MRENSTANEPTRITREDREEGTVIRVFVRGGTQAIKFDCFRRGAHYHLDPDGRNSVHPIKHPEPLQWAAYAIRESLSQLLQAAGYQEVVAEVKSDCVLLQLGRIGLR
jgi:hypothetical protein